MKKQDKEKIKKIAEKFNLELVMLFGSRARGNYRADSDFDIAIKAKRKINLQEELALIYEFSKIFSEKIDLSIIKPDPLLLHNISEDAILLFGSQDDFMKFKLYAFHCYNDYIPFLKKEADFVKKQISNL